MKLSAPLHVLKQRAKEAKRTRSIPLSAALNDVAKAEGFASWSLLQARMKTRDAKPNGAEDILNSLKPGDLALIGARPGLGKTRLALEIVLRGRSADRPCFFFSLEYTKSEGERKLAELDPAYISGEAGLYLDVSDQISAAHIIEQTATLLRPGSIIAIDYLQLLDQQRQKPPLQAQVMALKAFAQDSKCIILFISQIDRAYDAEADLPPGPEDIRLPNPLDLTLFNRKIFMQGGEIAA
ncbi:DNA helicase [Sneathiella marina]|uniref:DNA helicase n=1 Tax=Sneathiella marina TaxID=2950108 RepID=A0ABY4W6E8_9PROT|nr:DNA helicase [Sneathiella marina]USG62751.1 DNA helicase [Sneathiella marina]